MSIFKPHARPKKPIPGPIELGDYVRDTVTGIEGIAMARMTWLYSCSQIQIQPPAGADGKFVDGCRVDEPGVEILEKRKPPVTEAAKATPEAMRTGGPTTRATLPRALAR